uniref:Si:cabz01093077.1 n=1 Tax=Tetraodon nigroviridis TaxID=99883 RepID=H3DP69_TETNG
MNTSGVNFSLYPDIYDYDYNSTCDQDPNPVLSDTVLRLFYCVVFGFGLIGNSTVIWVLLQFIKLKTMADVCLLNLALSDLIFAVSLPLWAFNFQILALCKVMTAIYQVGFYSGTLFVTLMSLDRYVAIVHAVSSMRARTLHRGIIASISIWAVSIIIAAPQVKYASLEIDPENNLSQCQPLYPEDSMEFWKMRRNLSENIVALFVCLPIMIFCYVKILIVLSKSPNSKKDKAIRLIFAIVCVFVMCWVPYNVTVFLQTLQIFEILVSCSASRSISLTMSFAEIIALSHCCLNPIIYAFAGEKFRKSL